MPKNIKKQIKLERNRTYLAKDFDAFKSELLSYAKTYYPDNIQDFSESSLGGLLLDMVSYVGDTMSYYLDHQFQELFPTTSVETQNILRHLRSAGVPIGTVSPAVVDLELTVDIPAITVNNEVQPKRVALPVVGAGSVFISSSGIRFNLLDDINFDARLPDGNLAAEIIIKETDASGIPIMYSLTAVGTCVSGNVSSQSYIIDNTHIPFRELTLDLPDITEVISVGDIDGNRYYEVESLTQDNVFVGIPNYTADGDLVEQNLEVTPAPYRFIKIVDPTTRLTKIRFGSGDGKTLDNDIIPDPSKLSLSLYGKKNFSRFSIDPNSLLKTQTLGISPRNTTVTVSFRHLGGLDHNVGPGSINNISEQLISFPFRVDGDTATSVRNSFRVNNPDSAGGGLPAPTLDELRARVPQSRQLQSRIVSREDLLARIYTLPAVFGRVYRAGIRSNPSNSLATNLYVISQNIDGDLIVSPDSLKKNLRRYLNNFRMISDAIDVLDAMIINFGVDFSIISEPNSNKKLVIQNVVSRLIDILTVENFQIDQPIVLADIVNIIVNTPGVLSLVEMPRITSMTGVTEDRKYSSIHFNPGIHTIRGLVVGPPGSIFEMKFPDFDIIGRSG
jgi:hypothetical protein